MKTKRGSRTLTLEDKLKAGYSELAEFVHGYCLMLGCTVGRSCFGLCCGVVECEITRSFAADQRGVVLKPKTRNVHRE